MMRRIDMTNSDDRNVTVKSAFPLDWALSIKLCKGCQRETPVTLGGVFRSRAPYLPVVEFALYFGISRVAKLDCERFKRVVDRP